jgi:hypothetical protein
MVVYRPSGETLGLNKPTFWHPAGPQIWQVFFSYKNYRIRIECPLADAGLRHGLAHTTNMLHVSAKDQQPCMQTNLMRILGKG